MVINLYIFFGAAPFFFFANWRPFNGIIFYFLQIRVVRVFCVEG